MVTENQLNDIDWVLRVYAQELRFEFKGAWDDSETKRRMDAASKALAQIRSDRRAARLAARAKPAKRALQRVGAK